MLICPACKSALASPEGKAASCRCGAVYPRLASGGIDFLAGMEFPDFVLDPADPVQRRQLEEEAAGVSWRITHFILPLMGRYRRSAHQAAEGSSALDCGCGNGISVDALRHHGVDAWGIDAGGARHQQWRDRISREYLHSADALRLPFADRIFDAVVSSGLIEHIGIHEEETQRYRSRRLPDCHSRRRQFIAELVRVVKPQGFILLDHPNGAFPIDFWHGGRPGSFRLHAPFGDMLPRFREIAGYFHQADPYLHLFSLSPLRRLRFIQVRRHWYGKVFAPAMGLWLSLLDRQPLSFLCRTFLNPYLVTIATRQADAADWIHG